MLFPWYTKFPYQNDEVLNLDWILKTIDNLVKEVSNFVTLNTIKYADPIQWNITTQYDKNTVVIDPISGSAYISTKPVPAGVGLNNTDYWNIIFTLDVISANKNITLRDDANNMLATFESDEDDWLLWQGTLYIVTNSIEIGQAYVDDYNIKRYTVEMFLKDYISNLKNYVDDQVAAINYTIGSLDDLTTEDKDSIVEAINELVTSVSNVVTTIGDLDTLDTSVKTSVVAAINEVIANIGDLDYLDTEVKTSIVAAINEVIGDISALSDKIDLLSHEIESFTDIDPINVLTKNVSGSNNTYSGTITGAVFTSSVDTDFKAGQGVVIPFAGDVPNISDPTINSATYSGDTGSTSYEYKIFPTTEYGGLGNGSSVIVNNCSNNLSNSNKVSISFVGNSSVFGYAIYRNDALIAFEGTTSGNITFVDNGFIAIGSKAPLSVPSSNPSDATRKFFRTTIESVDDRVITLDAAPEITGAITLYHDDTDAIQTLLDGGNTKLYFPTGHYNLVTNLYNGTFSRCLSVDSNTEISGSMGGTVFYALMSYITAAPFINGNNVTGGAANTGIYLHDFTVDGGYITEDIHVNQGGRYAYNWSSRVSNIFMGGNGGTIYNIRIQRVISQNGLSGIVLNHVNRSSVKDCIIEHTHADGILVAGTSSFDFIVNNVINNSGDDGIGLSGQHSSILVSGNKISNGGSRGIVVQGSYNIITDNWIFNTAWSSIEIENYFANAYETSYNIVSNNYMQYAGYYTGGVNGYTNPTERALIKVYNSATASGTNKMYSNVIEGNTFYDNYALEVVNNIPSDPSRIRLLAFKNNNLSAAPKFGITLNQIQLFMHEGNLIQEGLVGVSCTAGVESVQDVSFAIHYPITPRVEIDVNSVSANSSGYITAMSDNIATDKFRLRVTSFYTQTVFVRWIATF